ncbi:MAG: diguanylate cyclase [Desulfuromonadaceae bacterium]|nr:diguanylate cyclase [Desulfuromonadaceae bacterium]
MIQKLIISFAISGICMTVALANAVIGLKEMHHVEEAIAHNNISAASAISALRETLIIQKRAVGKYQILGEDEFRELFRQNALEFRAALVTLRTISQDEGTIVLATYYEDYIQLCERIFGGKNISSQELQVHTKKLEGAIEKVRHNQQDSLIHILKIYDEKESSIVSRSILFACAGVAVSFLVAGLLVYSFASSIGKLQKATHRIAAGEFEYEHDIPTGDEIGSLAQDFTRMGMRLKDLEQMSLDASPLTRLPGNIAIERAINHRIDAGSSFALCYLDLDNFKSYNDRYGYIKASEVIKDVGHVIYDAARRLNDPDTFVGHIGGDDFVVIINGAFAEMACQAIISEVDAIIPRFYSDEDNARGAIEGIDRYGVPRVFPLISISISVLVCSKGDYASAAEIATAAARLKEQVKKTEGSNYIIVMGEHTA